jgi:hypothetical protein
MLRLTLRTNMHKLQLSNKRESPVSLDITYSMLSY